MNTVVIKRGIGQIADNLTVSKPLSLAVLIGLILYSATSSIVLDSLSEAYFQVSVFVAATLIGLLYFERVSRYELADVLNRFQNWQVPIAAFLGAVPGCGGAIIAITQYVRGSMSFGGVVAVLTATMGDAAFLLLAKRPDIALLIYSLSFVTGIVFGYIVDFIHGRDFMRVKVDYSVDEDKIEENPLLSPFYKVWMYLFIPGAIIGILTAFQVDVNQLFTIAGIEWVPAFGAACGLMAIVMWTFNPLSDIRMCISDKRGLSHRVADTTNFITFWVLCGFVGYGLLANFAGFDLVSVFDAWSYLLPLIAVVVGFIPGCGPQIVVTTLFLNGVIPLSAQIANAISNDGDALFPAVAIAPRAAVIATLYTAVPALLIGYGWLFAFE
ncbi:MAG: putative manganese transporter [Proteobacteria bacterium]|nr:putative manganese transporter [Pseudomonadota bacterium]